MVDPTNPDRDAGLLSKQQREYLLGTSDVEPETNADRMRRQRLRERIRGGLLDFSLLAAELREDDRDQIFESNEYDPAVADTIRFLYAALGSSTRFEPLLTWGVANAERDLGNVETSAQVDVEFEPHYIPRVELKEVAEHLKNNEYDKISPISALGALEVARLHGVLDPDDFVELDERINEASVRPEDKNDEE